MKSQRLNILRNATCTYVFKIQVHIVFYCGSLICINIPHLYEFLNSILIVKATYCNYYNSCTLCSRQVLDYTATAIISIPVALSLICCVPQAVKVRLSYTGTFICAAQMHFTHSAWNTDFEMKKSDIIFLERLRTIHRKS